MKKAIFVLVIGLFWCDVGFAEKIKLNCKLTPSSTVDMQKKYNMTSGYSVEWYLITDMPFRDGGNAWEGASAYFFEHGEKNVLLAFSDNFKITYRGNWPATQEEMTAFWTINRFTGRASFFAYKMPWADWEKGIDFINKRSPDKVGKPDWDWIYDIRTYFVKPNYDLFFKKMDFDCKKLEETKF